MNDDITYLYEQMREYAATARIIETEFAQRIGKTVKLHLKEKDGTFKNHYHRYKTEEKAEHMYEIFKKAINND